MPHDVCEIESDETGATVRVDKWDSTGRDWIYYFDKSDGESHYTLTSSASVPHEDDRIGAECGIESAEEKMRDEDYSISPHNNSEQ